MPAEIPAARAPGPEPDPAPDPDDDQVVADEGGGEWCLLYVSAFDGDACGQSITGVADGLLRSATNPAHFHRWRGRPAALAWLGARGLAEGEPIPQGVGYLSPVPHPFDPAWLRGGPPRWFREALYRPVRRRRDGRGEVRVYDGDDVASELPKELARKPPRGPGKAALAAVLGDRIRQEREARSPGLFGDAIETENETETEAA